MNEITIKEVVNKCCDVCGCRVQDYTLTIGNSTISLCKQCLQKLKDEVNRIAFCTLTFVRCDCYDQNNERCFGTREMDSCSCKGNALKCDFYDYKRNGGKRT